MAEARAKELQEELNGTYKEKSRLAEELVAASRQLQIVRDSNEAQARFVSASVAALLLHDNDRCAAAGFWLCSRPSSGPHAACIH